MNGYLEIDQNKWAVDEFKKTGNNDAKDSLVDWVLKDADTNNTIGYKSIRICLQYFPEMDDKGEATAIYNGQGKKDSTRYRVRFINKKIDDFTFHSEVATYRTDTNIDFNKNADDLESFCNKPFQPKKKSGKDMIPDYMEEITRPKEDQFGYAVIEQIINTYHRRFSIHFMRPLEQPEETQDLTFIEDDTYKVFLNWGIYPDHESTTPEAFYGHRNDGGLKLPDEDKPLQPRDMKI